ncbi:MAG: helix-turn-helix transcriptional regulator [Limisphaerales bacterium]
MSTVAEQLSGAREARKLTVQQVADATKIRTDHISALEQGNFSVFSAPVYIRGSVKLYAKLLKLDQPTIMAALDAELKNTEKFSEPPPFTEESNKPLDRVIYLLAKLNLKWVLAAIALAGIVVVVLIVNTVLKNHSRDPLANLPPAVYQTTNSGDTLPLPKK